VHGFALREAGGSEHLHARFFESENQAGGEGTRGVVERFFFGGDVHGDAAEGSRDRAGNSDRGGVALDRKDFAFKRRNADTIKGLHRVYGTGEGSKHAHGFQGASVTRAAGVQNDFPAELLCADAGELLGNLGDSVIGDAHQDGFGREDVMRDSRDGLTSADEFRGLARGEFGVCGDDESAPAAFVQQAAQRATHAASTENGQALWHPC